MSLDSSFGRRFVPTCWTLNAMSTAVGLQSAPSLIRNSDHVRDESVVPWFVLCLGHFEDRFTAAGLKEFFWKGYGTSVSSSTKSAVWRVRSLARLFIWIKRSLLAAGPKGKAPRFRDALLFFHVFTVFEFKTAVR